MLNRFCLLDLETIPALDCEQWLSPFEADRRLTDQAKIAADIAKKRQEQLESAALDPDLNQIIAFGWQTESMDFPNISVCTAPEDEPGLLEVIWQLVNPSRPMVGYGASFFDLGVLVRRSQLLGVSVPSWVYKQGKYRHDNVIELADYLTLNGMIEQKKGRTLDYHCKRLGIGVPDTMTGKDVPQAVAEGRFTDVTAHLTADLTRIRLLAERLGVIDQVREEAVL